MKTSEKPIRPISLKPYGISHTNFKYQIDSLALHEIALQKGMGKEASSGALAVNTGEFTGRAPQDRFIVKDAITKDEVWWGDINKSFDPKAFDSIYKKVIAYLNDKEL
ncbi:MAG: phosphoenolpyruvate carboxykinase (ATP), partial [Bacteroidota bacterium]